MSIIMAPMNDHRSTAWPRARALGDAALTIEFGDAIDPAIHARVTGFAAALQDRRDAGELPELIEWVPAFASLTAFFEPGKIALDEAADTLRALAREAAPLAHGGRRWRIPVCFEGDCAPDREAVAKACGIDPGRVVELLCETEFLVYMLGFMPGFPYLGGLPEQLALPRRASPRDAVPERSLAIAGRMCAVYPWHSPGGWHLLGRTPLRPFELGQRTRPALFAPGDKVRWQPIDRERYQELDQLAARGELAREQFLLGDEVAR